MMTFEGKNHIKRYLAGYAASIAQSASFGIGTRAENAGDIALQMETTKSSINLTSYDFANNKLIYKASIPDEYVGKIYEVGIYSLPADPAAGEFASRTLTTFDSATEDWVSTTDGITPPDYTSTATRIGVDSMFQNPGASANMGDTLRGLALDLSGYSAADSFVFALSVGNANTQNVVYRFVTDTSNYYSFTITTEVQTAGYKFVEIAKGSAAVTGAPNWSNITEIQVITTSKSSGTSSVELDGIRIEDKDAASLDYILVARKVLPSPVTKVAGQSQDIEFTLDVTL